MNSGNDFFGEALADFRKGDQWRAIDSFEPLDRQGPWVEHGGRRCLNLCSNDYLGLSRHESLGQAASQAAISSGTGTGGSRLLSGARQEHENLERKLAQVKGLPKTLLLNSGFTANVGVIPALSRGFDTLLVDRFVHASMIDGLILARKPFHRYRHLDMEHLDELLAKQPTSARIMVITESLFSMEGDFLPVEELLALQKRHGFFLYVDEAHSAGCHPHLLRPLVDACGEHLVLMGTFGKAYGSYGAYVAGPERVIDYLVNTCRSFIFSTSLPPAVTAANLAALRVVEQETWRHEKLQHLIGWAQEHLGNLLLPTSGAPSQICPLVLGSNERALEAARILRENGYYTLAVRHPTVARGQARLRMNLGALMEESDLQDLPELLRSLPGVTP